MSACNIKIYMNTSLESGAFQRSTIFLFLNFVSFFLFFKVIIFIEQLHSEYTHDIIAHQNTTKSTCIVQL